MHRVGLHVRPFAAHIDELRHATQTRAVKCAACLLAFKVDNNAQLEWASLTLG
jgi:hypothetical protein